MQAEITPDERKNISGSPTVVKKKPLTPQASVDARLKEFGFKGGLNDAGQITDYLFYIIFESPMKIIFDVLLSDSDLSIEVESESSDELFSRHVLFELLLVKHFEGIILRSSSKYRTDMRKTEVQNFHLTHGERRVIRVEFKKGADVIDGKLPINVGVHKNGS